MEKYNIFKRSSTTYYTASLFFPPDKRSDIASLYAFVRKADDYVDSVPQDATGFLAFKHDYLALHSVEPVVIDFKRIEKQYGFYRKWTTAFLQSMEMDLHVKEYKAFSDLETYIYGSAEVIGLYMSRLLGISPAADPYARLLGKAMQLINFIRDIQEDLSLGRVYLPQDDLQKYNIMREVLSGKQSQSNDLEKLIRFEIERYYILQQEAEKGYHLIPRRYRIAIKTAADMYNWTAHKIYENPLIVFQKKIKPSKWRILTSGVLNFLTA